MAKVNVSWTEVRVYEGTLEVPGHVEDVKPSALKKAITALDEDTRAGCDQGQGDDDIEIMGWDRADDDDSPARVPVTAPSYTPDFEL